MLRIAVLASAVVLVALGAASGARASSIVFTQDDGNVWLAAPDGSNRYQVTLDGTPGDPYEGPSQADDGTIVAARGSGSGRRIYRLRQNGALLNEPIATVGIADEPRIAPDGSLVAYWFLTAVSYTNCFYCIGTYDQTVYTYPDRLTRYEDIPGPHCCQQPSWMGNQGIFMTNGSGTAWYHMLGRPEAEKWFTDPETIPADSPLGFRDGEVSPALDRIALVRGDSQETIQLYQTNGPPPATPTAGCTFTGASGGKFIGPTWSPDGASLAWEDASGIVVAPVPSVTDCAAINAAGPARVVIPGGHKPDWGPADVSPGARGGGGGTATAKATPPKVSLKLRKQRLRTALKRGYAVGVTSSEPGGGGIELFLGKTRVALGTRAFPKAGTTQVVAKFTKKGRGQIGRRHTVRLRLRATVLDMSANPAVVLRWVTLKR